MTSATAMRRIVKSFLEWARVGKVCSYKRVTISICLFNLLLAIYVLRSLYVFSSHPSDIWHTIDQAKRVEESAVVRRALGPVGLFRLKVEKLRVNSHGEGRGLELSQSVKRKLADEILQRLRLLGDGANLTEQREALGLWHAEKLKALKQILPISKEGSSMAAKEAKMLASALESDWVKLLEDIGIWIPSVVANYEINDRPENATDYEEDTVSGPLPPECHAEPHTDYDGAAIRWGLTHHKSTAADCCQACIDQAKDAKVGQIKCNIWVYCPSEFGCYSPDIYEHRYQECWLKQAKKPRLNFKDKYSETYRDSHPTAPVAVPWISGVIGS